MNLRVGLLLTSTRKSGNEDGLFHRERILLSTTWELRSRLILVNRTLLRPSFPPTDLQSSDCFEGFCLRFALPRSALSTGFLECWFLWLPRAFCLELRHSRPGLRVYRLHLGLCVPLTASCTQLWVFWSQGYCLLRSNAAILLSDMEATVGAFIFACRIAGFLAISSLFLHLMAYLESIHLLFGML